MFQFVDWSAGPGTRAPAGHSRSGTMVRYVATDLAGLLYLITSDVVEKRSERLASAAGKTRIAHRFPFRSS